ncbi:hypothetical protein GYMLUDRAFT_174288 [Collybiopsis luxurians FD-317 M1]|uniref:Uncharacterized protein n=1 Tax=Collybiopsis luxurians FD-317 M1 TaxID=944289 RepID=A0A0D0B0B8_9AGAR|nr:hypothetical protein GYMLUDRAFT_174288 [Collybiopsis luxurians FD-317 M1]
MQRHVLGQLEHSFENVGLLPSTKEKKSSGKKSALYTGGSISSRLSHKKMDVLSCVPADAYFMLLPLWPAETDTYSQRLSPFQAPSIPSDDRRYLLVFYKPLPFEGLTKGTSSLSTSDLRKILLPGFHAMARQVSHSELEGTGVRVPEQGISVNGPLEDAFKRIPRSLSHTLYSSTGDNSSVQPYIIGTSKSRDAGVEFDPEALVDLGLCTVLNEEQRRSLPPGMVVEQFDSEQATTVKLTPIGSAVMEMIWVGGLALTSFGS